MVTKQSVIQEIEITLELLKKGLLNGDRSLLDQISDEDLSYGHSDGNTETKAEVIEAFATGKYKFSSINISSQSIQIFGDTSVVRQKFYATTADQGKLPGEVHLFVVTVWKKNESSWKMIARQAVKNPELIK